MLNESAAYIEETVRETKQLMADLALSDPELADTLINPLIFRYDLQKEDATNVQVLYPTLLTLILVFISILFANILTLLEIHDKAYVRNILAPVNDILFIAGIFITAIIIIGFQSAIMLVLGQTLFELPIAASLPTLVPVLLALILVFVALGMIIAYLAKNTVISVLLTTFAVLLVFLISDLFTLQQAMPALASLLVDMNPMVIASNLIRTKLFYDIGLSLQSSFLIFFMAFWLAAIAILVAKIQNKKRI